VGLPGLPELQFLFGNNFRKRGKKSKVKKKITEYKIEKNNPYI